MSSKNYKKCVVPKCENLVEGIPMELEFPLCENHKTDEFYVEYRMERIKSERYVNTDYMRIFDENGKKLCLVCGGELKGRQRTYCKEHNLADLDRKFNCSSISGKVLYQRGQKCEVCGKEQEFIIEKYNMGYGEFREYKRPVLKFEVHHIVPVHSLDKTDSHLLFDENNLIVLCDRCHKKVRSKRTPILKQDETIPEKKYKKLFQFVE